jgi:hypothetical protein
MGFYQSRILPKFIDLSMRNRDLAAYRERVLSAAAGRVLAPEQNVRRWQDRLTPV